MEGAAFAAAKANRVARVMVMLVWSSGKCKN
jgi:hypothetical protein